MVGSAAASALCTSAVARPRACASAVKSAPARSRPSASCQPSSEPRRYGWSTPRVSGSDPGSSASYQATGAGTREQPAAARARGSSRSGLTPGPTRLKIFRMYESP